MPTKSDRVEKIARKNPGLSHAEIARRAGCRRALVYQIRIKRLSYVPAKRKLWRGTAVESRMKRALARGVLSDAAIARMIGISGSTVSKYRRALGLQGGHFTSTLDQRQQALKLAAKGTLSYSQIAAMVGISRNAIAGAVYRDRHG